MSDHFQEFETLAIKTTENRKHYYYKYVMDHLIFNGSSNLNGERQGKSKAELYNTVSTLSLLINN